MSAILYRAKSQVVHLAVWAPDRPVEGESWRPGRHIPLCGQRSNEDRGEDSPWRLAGTWDDVTRSRRICSRCRSEANGLMAVASSEPA